MKNLILVLALVLFFTSTSTVSAQMMGGWGQDWSSTANCNQPDSYYQKIGDQAMRNMMGEELEESMEKRIGEDFSKQMDIRMGKALSGCTASYQGRGLMGPWMMTNWGQVGSFSFFGWYYLIIQILFLAILVLVIIYLWQKINPPAGRKK